MFRIILPLATLVLFAFPAMGEEVYWGVNPSDSGDLVLVGFRDGTTYTVANLDDGSEIASGELDRFDIERFDVAGAHHFSVTASSPLLAHLGYDCCGVGGTTFFPTEDGHARVGRSFLFNLPVLGTGADLVVFAVEDAEIYLMETDGTVVSTRVVEAGRYWLPYPMVGAHTYLLRSTGDVSVMLNAVNGVASVPPANRAESCDSDVGRLFYLFTHSWGGGAIAAFAYEDASVLAEPLEGGDPVIEVDLVAGEHVYVTEVGRRAYRVTSTGDISVWTGDLEGGEGIGDMGDDFSCNLGRGGENILFHSQNHGATIFATVDGTTLTMDEEEHLLDRGEWLDVEAGLLTEVSANHPLVTFAFGGNTLNDWGGNLRPAPREGPDEACPDLDADIPAADGDADADFDFDEDLEQDSDLDVDVESGDADLTIDSGESDDGEGSGEARWSCDCQVAHPAVSRPGSLRLLSSLLSNVVWP